MKGSLRWRIPLTLVVLLLALMYMLPSFKAVKDSPVGKVLPEDKINLGLDLQGGMHLMLGVDIDKAVNNSLAQMGQDLRAFTRDEDVRILKPTVRDDEGLEFELIKPDQQKALEDIIKKSFSNFTVESVTPTEEGRLRYVLALDPDYRNVLAKRSLDQAVKTIRNRIDQFGVAEPDIRTMQNYQIQVQLPGLEQSDFQRTKDILAKTAHLEFKLVDEEANLENAAKGILPPGTELLYFFAENGDGVDKNKPIVVMADAALTGEYITDAGINFDSYNTPYVWMNFNRQGARIFERVTGENIKKKLAIVLDDKVFSAPVIQSKIAGGRAQISGRFTDEEAQDLALVLRAGALPAPVNILEERTVGPSLGEESINMGVKSAVIGMAIVLGFMVIYYGFAGLVADLVLVFNIVLIMAGLAAFGATLTLPGIAGIILTIGMAVDANVLIFERIREELRNGLTPRAAVEEGYGTATLTILDANVTTIIAAVILYQFGTGPVRGFAVTLSLGILASMFTAIFVSRILFDLWVGRKSGAKLSI